jgi:Mg2+ and Co2+ transporter CorA
MTNVNNNLLLDKILTEVADAISTVRDELDSIQDELKDAVHETETIPCPICDISADEIIQTPAGEKMYDIGDTGHIQSFDGYTWHVQIEDTSKTTKILELSRRDAKMLAKQLTLALAESD